MLLQVLAGRDPRDPGALRDEPDDYVAAMSRGVEGMKIGWSADFGFVAVEPEIRDSAAEAARAFEDLGAVVEEVNLVLDTPFDQFWPLFTAIMYARVASVVDEHWDKLTWYAQESLETGKNITGAEFVNALGYVDVMKSQFADAFDEYDLILTPTLATPAFPVGEPPATIGGRDVHWFWGYTPYTMPINMIGSTAASIPVRVLLRRPAHRPPHHRRSWCRVDRVRRLRRLRGGASVDPAPPAGGVGFGIVNHRDNLLIVMGLHNCSVLRYTSHHNTHQMMFNMMNDTDSSRRAG